MLNQVIKYESPRWNPRLLSEDSPTQTELKIKEFTNLEAGWCYSEGIVFSRIVIDLALKISKQFNDSGFLKTDAFPGVSGEIMVTAYQDDYYCEIMVYFDNKFDFIAECCDDEITREEKIDQADVDHLLNGFREKVVCSSSEHSTYVTLIKQNKDSLAWLSKIQVVTEEYLLLNEIVSFNQKVVFANISTSSTAKYQEIP